MSEHAAPETSEQEHADVLGRVTEEVTLEYAQGLMRFPSINPPGDYEGVTAYVLDEFEKLQLEIATTKCHEGRINVVGRLPGVGDGNALCLAAHTDVVGVGDVDRWSFDPFVADVENGLLRGRGSADSKGMLAGMMTAVRAIRESGARLSGDLYLVAYTDDETAGPCGLRDAYAQNLIPVERLVLGEATNFEVQYIFKARLWFSVEVFGRSSHGAFPDRGINAIDKAYLVMEAIRSIPLMEHDVLGKDTVSIGMIEGGEQVNVVAGSCRVWFDVRWSPPRSSAEIRDLVSAELQKVATKESDIRIGEIQVTEERDPLEFDTGSELNETIVSAGRTLFGRNIGRGGWYSSGELWPVWQQGRIRMGAVVGPGEPWQAHSYDEHISVQDLVDGARLYTLIALGVCGRSE